MKILRSLMLLAVAVMFSVGALAQADTTVQAPKLTPSQRAERQTVSMSKHLQLTPEQTEQVKVINLKYAELQQSATRQNRKANKQARNAEMEKILTPAQYQQLLQQELRKGKGSKDRAAVKRDTVKQTDQPAEE